jgi:hypothetical protein
MVTRVAPACRCDIAAMHEREAATELQRDVL